MSYFLGSLPLCPVEDIFLCRLMQKDSIEASQNDEIVNYVEEALALRQSSSRELLKLIEDTIHAQRERTYCIAQDLHGKATSEGQNVLPSNCRVILFTFGLLMIKLIYFFFSADHQRRII